MAKILIANGIISSSGQISLSSSVFSIQSENGNLVLDGITQNTSTLSRALVTDLNDRTYWTDTLYLDKLVANTISSSNFTSSNGLIYEDLIISGSTIGDFTGSLLGTASFAISSSHSDTSISASHSLNSDLLGGNPSSYYLPTTCVSGTATYIPKFTGPNSIGDSVIYQSSSFISIGTTSASANLHVEGSGSTLFKVDGYNGTLFSVNDDLSDSLMSVNDVAGLPVFEVFADDTIIGGRYNQNDFYLQGSDGNIGIGTNLPVTRLTVSGSISASGDLYLDQRLYDITDSSGSNQQILTAIGNGNKWHNLIDITGSVTGSGTPNYLTIWDTQNSLSSSGVYQDNNGNIGIGTANPTTSLHLYTDVAAKDVVLRLDANSTGQSYIELDRQTSNGCVYIKLQDASVNKWSFGSFCSDRFDILEGHSTSCNRLSIIPGGNIGIGTITPTQNVHIAENIRVEGAYYDSFNSPGTSGQILKSTFTGTEWSNIVLSGGQFEGNFTGSISGSQGTFDNITVIYTGSFGYVITDTISGSKAYIYNLYDSNESSGSVNQVLTSTVDGIEWKSGITASLYGTSSWSNNSITASYVTASNSVIGDLSVTNISASNVKILSGLSTDGDIHLYGITENTEAFDRILVLDDNDKLYHTSNISASRVYTGEITSSLGGLFTDKVTIDGDLLVTGQSLLFSASYINITSSNVNIGDNIITLNAYSPFKTYAGIEMHDSGSSAIAQFLWDSAGNYFFVSGSTATNSQNQILLGPDGKADLTAGYLPVSYNSNELSSSIIYQGGLNIGIGTSSPTQKLEIHGNIRVTGSYYDSNNSAGTSGQILSSTATGTDWVDASEVGIVDGSGTLNYLAKWTPDGNSLGDSVIYDDGSHIGIGTLVMSNTLTVNGDVYIENSLTASAITTSYIDLDSLSNGVAPPHKAGRLFYDDEEGALTFYNNEADISLQIGQEFYIRVYNDTGGPILNGNVVYISGSHGDNPYVWKAAAEDHTTTISFDNHVIGVTTHTIEDKSVGYVTTQGIVRGIDTTAFNAGDILFVSQSAGELTNTPPQFPYDILQVGYVIRSHSNGFVYVHPQESVHFSNISGLSGSFNAHVGDLWVYQSNNAWTHTKYVPELTSSIISSSNIYVSSLYDSNSSSGSSGQILSSTSTGTCWNNLIDITGAITGSGTPNYLTMWDTPNSLSSSGVYQDSNGNIGINTATPSTKFEVVGTVDASTAIFRSTDNRASVSIQSAATDQASYLQLKSSTCEIAFLDGNYDSSRLRIATTKSGAYITLETGVQSEAVRILSDGNVGIGTTTPSNQLTTYKATSNYFPISLQASDIGTPGQYLGVQFGYTNGTYQKGAIIYQSADAYARGRMVFALDNTVTSANADVNDVVLALSSSGCVGIGTLTPSQKLHVCNGRIAVNDGYNIGSTDANTGMFVSSNAYYVQTNGSTRLTIDSFGCAGLGTTTPSTDGPTIAQHLVVKGAGSTGITVHAPDANNATYNFGSVSDNDYAYLQGYYNSGTPFVRGSIATTEIWRWAAGGIYVGNSYELSVGGGSDTKIGSLKNNSGNLYLQADSTRDIQFGGTAGGVSVTIDTSAGNVGIGNTSPSQKLQVNGNVVISGSGTDVKYILDRADARTYSIYTESNSDFRIRDEDASADRVTIKSDGNVGIGTTSPVSTLEIVNNNESTTQTNFTQALTSAGLIINTQYTNNAYTPGLFWKTSNENSTKPKAGVYLKESGAGTTMYFGTSDDYSTGITNNVVINPDGNVGIGTTSPTSKLHIVGNITSSAADSKILIEGTVRSTNNGNIYGDNFVVNTTNKDTALYAYGVRRSDVTYGGIRLDGRVLAYSGSVGNPGLTFISDVTTGLYSPTANQLGFSTNGSESIRINSLGNVGIGNTSPSQKLQIDGNIRVTGSYYDSNNSAGSSGQILSSTGTGTDWLNLIDISGAITGSGTTNYLPIWDTTSTLSSSILYQDSSGNIGISCTSPTHTLTFSNDNSASISLGGGASTCKGIYIYRNSSTNYAFIHSNGSGDLEFDTGTYSPATRLHIENNSGNIGIGTSSPGYKLDVNGTARFVGHTYANCTLRVNTTNLGATSNFFHVSNGTGGSACCTSIAVVSVADNSTFSGGSAALHIVNDGNRGSKGHASGSDLLRLDFSGSYIHTVFNKDGNVGIGTASPTNPLHIVHSGTNAQQALFINNTNNGYHAGIKFSDHVAGTQNGIFYYDHVDASSNGTDNSFHFNSDQPTLAIILDQSGSNSGYYIGESNPTVAIRGGSDSFFNGGNVGIGTTTPVEKLHVAGNIRVTGSYYDSNNSAGSSGQILSSTATGTDWLNLIDISGAITGSGTTNTLAIWDTTNSLSSSAVYQNSNGNIGINTTTPAYKLQVSGSTSLYTGKNNWNYVGPNGLHLARESYFGYGCAYTVLQLGTATTNCAIAIGVDVSGNSSNQFGGNEIIFPNQVELITPNTTNNGYLGLLATDNNNKLRIGNYNWNLLNDTPGITIDTSASTNYVGIRTTTPSVSLTVEGSISASGDFYLDGKLYDVNNSTGTSGQILSSTGTGTDWINLIDISGAITGSGTPNYLTMWDTANSLSSSILYQSSSGNIGIGTNAPDRRLHVFDANLWQGRFAYDSNRYLDIGYQGILATYNAFGNDMYVGTVSAGASNGHLIFQTIGSERARISRDGNVGIGVTSPAAQLHVSASSTHYAGRFESPSDAQILLKGDSSWAGIAFQDNSSNDALYYRGSTSTFSIGGGGSSVSGKKLHIDGATSIGSTFDACSVPTNGLVVSGSVGIGLNSPNGKLHIKTNTGTDTAGGSDSHIIFDVADDGGPAWGMRLGDVSTDGDFHIDGRIGGSWYNAITIERNTGQVGIGSLVPDQKLRVDGNIRVTGSYYDSNNSAGSSGQILSSTATGTDWVNLIDISGAITGSGTPNYLTMWDTANSLSSSAVYQNSNGNIGISCTTPSAKLHIVKSSTYNSEGTAGFKIEDGTSDVAVVMGADAGNDVFYIQSLDPGTSYGTRPLTLNPNGGSVGIGTINPLHTVHVSGDARINSNLHIGSAALTNAYITLYGDGNAAHSISSRDNTFSAADDIRINSYGAIYLNLDSNNNNTAGADFQIGRHGGIGTISDWFFTVNGETGNVGIGTTNPQNPLHIVHSGTTAQQALFIHNTNNGCHAGIKFSDHATATQNGIFYYDHVDASSNGTDNSFHFNSDQPSIAIIVDQSGSNSGYYIGESNPTVAIRGGADSFFNGGNVGIGNTNPLYKFHTVGGAGVFDVTGAATINHHLTVSEGTPSDWRPYSGTTTAALQIQTGTSPDRGILLVGKTTGNQDLYFTQGVDVYVSSSFGSTAAYKGIQALTIISASQSEAYVGIGITTPTKKLHVYNSDALINGVTVGIGGTGTEALSVTNTTLGYNALSSSTNSQYNVAIGYQSLTKNISSYYNVGIGYRSLCNIKTGVGNCNVGIGYLSLETNRDGFNNVGVGAGALGSNESGSYNVAVGTDAGLGYYQSTDNYNVSLGDSSGYNDGACNISIGYLTTNTAASTNSITIGHNSVGLGSNTTKIGNNSTVCTIFPAGNVGIGTTTANKSLHIVTSGATDAAICVDASVSGNSYITLDRQTSLGCAYVNFQDAGTDMWGVGTYGADRLDFVENSTTTRMTIIPGGNVGIGEVNPAYLLHLSSSNNTNILGMDIGSYATVNVSADSNSKYTTCFHMDNTGLDIGHDSVIRSLTLKTGNTDRLTILGGGNVGIGTTSPTQKLQIDGNIRVTGSYYDSNNNVGTSGQILSSTVTGTDWINLIDISGAITGSGTTCYIPVWEASGKLGNSNIYKDVAGNIGIGTTSPGEFVHVRKDHNAETALYIQNNNDAAGAGALLKIAVGGQSADGDARVSFTIGNGGSDWSVGVDNSDADKFKISGGVEDNFPDLATNPRLTISSSGNVGIATEDPTARLHVEGSGSTLFKVDGYNGTLFSVEDDLSDSLMSVNDAAGLPVFEVFADDTIIGGRYNQNDFYLQGSDGNIGIGTSLPSAKFEISSSTADPLMRVKGFGGENILYISSSGNVGINTSTPSTKFEVVGTVDASTAIFRSTTNRASVSIQSAATDQPAYLQLKSSTSEIAFLDGNYDSSRLRIATTKSGAYIALETDVQSEAVRILSNGNVGIGTTLPEDKIDIVGRLRISENKTATTNKTNRIRGEHYDITEEPVTFMYMNAWSTTNILYIGGGSSIENAATQLNFYTAANNTTTTGTLRIMVASDGNVGIGTATPTRQLTVHSSSAFNNPNSTVLSYATSDNSALVGSITKNVMWVTGSIQLGNNNDAIVFGRGTSTFLKDEELGFGWGGGWYMTDSTYIRSRGNKTIYGQDIELISSSSIRIGSTDEYRYDDNSGYGGISLHSNDAYTSMGTNIQVSNNTSKGWANLYLNKIDPISSITDADSRLIAFYGDGSRKWDLNLNSDGDIGFNNIGTGDFLVLGGNVGLGTLTPSEKLTVNGNISSSGDFYLDGALYDVNNSPGAVGSILTSTGTAVEWASGDINISGAFEGNFTGSITGSYGIFDNITIAETGSFGYIVSNVVSGSDFYIYNLNDRNDSTGSNQQILISTKNGIEWTDYTVISGSISGSGTANYTALWTSDNELSSSTIYQDSNGNIGIGTSGPSYKLEVNGEFAAPVKHFIVTDPTNGKKLVHSSLEGPENGVYIRGKSNENSIKLPEYWKWLINVESISVNLTPIGKYQHLYVKSISDTEIIIGNTYIDKLFRRKLNYYYTIFAERKDVNKLQIYK